MEGMEVDGKTAKLIQKYNVSVAEAIRCLYCSHCDLNSEKCPCPLRICRPPTSQHQKNLLSTDAGLTV